ncbi:hypothetical protein HETIRDRAFT_454372 [Heterobasidion irregulare TC 32-1]|uniref:Uncharacterized protein n=1 Tax=Heterobasidion irregulare (strain TC 32-1) TaxID=747525 RepID=W4JZB8_HETIT|nr:uncharacterized protein HETIRDRAFT_454372 [Heterobasidion irregulare TC 32-1]ETW78430.1 hypothetical protein HETIRDRAFT_454372 [Heterobasidion irregulare TC 32-1]
MRWKGATDIRVLLGQPELLVHSRMRLVKSPISPACRLTLQLAPHLLINLQFNFPNASRRSHKPTVIPFLSSAIQDCETNTPPSPPLPSSFLRALPNALAFTLDHALFAPGASGNLDQATATYPRKPRRRYRHGARSAAACQHKTVRSNAWACTKDAAIAPASPPSSYDLTQLPKRATRSRLSHLLAALTFEEGVNAL